MAELDISTNKHKHKNRKNYEKEIRRIFDFKLEE